MAIYTRTSGVVFPSRNIRAIYKRYLLDVRNELTRESFRIEMKKGKADWRYIT